MSTLEILHNEAGDGTIFLKNKPLFIILINAFSFWHIWSYISGDLIPLLFLEKQFFRNVLIHFVYVWHLYTEWELLPTK